MQLFSNRKNLLFICLLSLTQIACAKKNNSIYGNLSADQDGAISSEIPNEESSEFPNLPDTAPQFPDELSSVEKKLTQDMHSGQTEKLSFLVVNAETQVVIRSHLATVPRRLASLTKITTAISALRNVSGVNYDKVGNMLKTSNNGEASRYVRLAAKAIDNLVVTGGEYTAASSCPMSTTKEIPAANSVLKWLTDQLPAVDWSDAVIRDGAGCDYGNHFSALQTIHVLKLASSYGKIFDGNSFEDLLSISGVEGTWKNFNTDSKGMIFAKTGTLAPNSNLAGYFYVKRNNKIYKYFFAIFVEKRVNIDSSAAARKFIEALVRNWIHQLSREEMTLSISL